MRPPINGDANIVYLKPGELFTGRGPAIVQTVLGSCIAVTMHSPRLRRGAICHALLPSGPCTEPGEHVDIAIITIFEKMLALGASRNELVVKLFGGSRVLGGIMPEQPGKPSIGDQNIDQAIKSLSELDLQPVASDIGGELGRKIIFYTENGDVYVRKQRSSPALRSAGAALQETGSNKICRRLT
jgi:chemotaxis protein CheD